MTLQDLRYLIALADHGHFGRAAEACHITQPTLSTQLKKLEDFLGVTLFERTNKTLRLTPEGQPIVAKARQIVAEAETLVALARAQGAPMAGPLQLGIIPTLSPYLLPWFLPALKKTYPDLKLIVHEDLTQQLLARLHAHRIDAALIALPVAEAEFAARPLFDEPFFLACPTGHKLSHAKAVSPENLKAERLLLLTDGHCLRDQTLAICHDAVPAYDEVDFRATSLETLRQMVAAGMGCTLLPALALGPRDPRLAIRPLTGDASRRIGLVWRKSYPKAAELEQMAELICGHLPASLRAIAL